jgi:D-arabinose 5-phosphate isomerase GutQ
MQAEAAAIQLAAERLDASFERALDLILDSGSKLVICGIGRHEAGGDFFELRDPFSILACG